MGKVISGRTLFLQEYQKEAARERKVMIIGHLIDISRLIFHYS